MGTSKELPLTPEQLAAMKRFEMLHGVDDDNCTNPNFTVTPGRLGEARYSLGHRKDRLEPSGKI